MCCEFDRSAIVTEILICIFVALISLFFAQLFLQSNEKLYEFTFITVRGRVFQKTERQFFGLAYKISVSNSFGSALRKCQPPRFNALNRNPMSNLEWRGTAENQVSYSPHPLSPLRHMHVNSHLCNTRTFVTSCQPLGNRISTALVFVLFFYSDVSEAQWKYTSKQEKQIFRGQSPNR